MIFIVKLHLLHFGKIWHQDVLGFWYSCDSINYLFFFFF